MGGGGMRPGWTVLLPIIIIIINLFFFSCACIGEGLLASCLVFLCPVLFCSVRNMYYRHCPGGYMGCVDWLVGIRSSSVEGADTVSGRRLIGQAGGLLLLFVGVLWLARTLDGMGGWVG